jgi:hypothetical protein
MNEINMALKMIVLPVAATKMALERTRAGGY